MSNFFIDRPIFAWVLALILMMAGSIVGGYSGAGAARKIGQKNVRKVIIFLGLTLTVVMAASQIRAAMHH